MARCKRDRDKTDEPDQMNSFHFIYVLPPLLGIVIGTAWGLLNRARLRAQLAVLVEERVGEIRRTNAQLLENNRQLAEESITDPLTGILNRRFMAAHMEREAARILRLRESKGATAPGNVLLVVDIDDFKAFNDRHGHVRGDQALVRFAEILKGAVRDSDYVVRWGGEEFVVLATDARAEDGEIIAERILASIREQEIVGEPGCENPVRCSIGVSHFPFFPDRIRALHWQQVLQVADLCAYAAKRNGKDGWVSLRGQEYDAGFLYGELLDELCNAPDELFLDKKFIMTRSSAAADPTVPAATAMPA